MQILWSLVLGYLIGTLSPAALIGKLKHKSLKKSGTGNLGATNTMIVFGKRFGALVMVFDIGKAVIASWLAGVLFPDLALAALLAGAASVVGHIFPFYLKFQGGKGLASFGGMVLAHDPLIFLILLCIGLAAMLIVNYGVALPISAAILFPILAWLRSRSITVGLIACAVSLLLIGKHISNIFRILRGEDIKIRDVLKGKPIRQ